MSDTLDELLADLSDRERLFVELYAGSAAGNGVKACKGAGYAGDAAVLAVQAYRLLRKAKVRAVLDAFLESDPAVAGRVERLQFLTRVMRGEVFEERVVDRDDEGKPIMESCPASIKDRLAAQDALAKLGGDYVTKVAPVNSQGEDLKNTPFEQLMAIVQMGKTG